MLLLLLRLLQAVQLQRGLALTRTCSAREEEHEGSKRRRDAPSLHE